MHRAVEPGIQRLLHSLGVQEVRDDELGACRDRLAVPPLEVVEHGHFVAGREQLAGDDRADIAGSAGHEQPHGTE